MAIDLSTYAGLQAAVATLMERSNDAAFVANIPIGVQRAEARLNRKIPAIETDATLTGTASSRVISISSLAMERPIALFLAESGQDERRIDQQGDGAFPYQVTTGRPQYWTVDGLNINFNRPLNAAYPFRLRYRQRLALATTSPNWLLTNHPDVYLAATMVWGFIDQEDDGKNISVYKGLLEEAMPEICHEVAQANRGTLQQDAAIANIGRWGYRYNINTDSN